MNYLSLVLSFLAISPVATVKTTVTTYTEIGSADAGRVVYCSLDLNQKSVAVDMQMSVTAGDTAYSLWLRPIGDPNIDQLGVERLPFNPPPTKVEQDRVKPTLNQFQRQKVELFQSIKTDILARRAQLLTVRQNRAETLAEKDNRQQAEMDARLRQFAAHPALVESTRVESNLIWWVKWRNRGWERMEISTAPAKTAAARKQELLMDANNVLNALRANQLVIIDRGYIQCSATLSQRQAMEHDLALLRQGGLVSSFFPERVRNRFRNPTSLQLILQGEEKK